MSDQAPKSPTSGSAEEKSPVRPCAPCGEPVPWIPESKLPPLPREHSIANSLSRNILPLSHLHARMWLDMPEFKIDKPLEISVLRERSKKIKCAVILYPSPLSRDQTRRPGSPRSRACCVFTRCKLIKVLYPDLFVLKGILPWQRSKPPSGHAPACMPVHL